MKEEETAMNEAYLKAGHNAYFSNGFYAGVEFAKPKWIEVNKELPEINEIGFVSVVGYNKFWGRCLLNMEYINDTKFVQWKTWCGESITPPTHWQHLPECPESDEKQNQ
jgi:hypothetical protein